jgi:hypothetical protein
MVDNRRCSEDIAEVLERCAVVGEEEVDVGVT